MKYLKIAAVVLVFFGGFVMGAKYPLFSRIRPINTQTDTLYIRDTITAYKPLYLTRYVDREILVPVMDTIRERDTLFVMLQGERIVWEDSLARVYASGYKVRVDSVQHFTEQKIITQYVPKPSRWSLGVSAGVGASSAGLSPFVGVGVTYSIFSW